MRVGRATTRLAFVVVGFLAVGAAFGMRGAWADTGLSDAIPRAGAVLETAPTEIVLDFVGDIESALSSVRLFDASGTEITMDAPLSTPDHTQIVVPVHSPEDLAAGVYVVRYRVTSLDAHVERGAFAFQIGTGTANQQAVLARVGGHLHGSVPLAWLLGVMRLVAIAALALLLGSWTIGALDSPSVGTSGFGRVLVTRQGWLGVCALALSAVLTFAAQGAQSSGEGFGGLVDVSGWSDEASARIGTTLLVRLGLVILAGLVVRGFGLVGQRAWRVAAIVVGACLAVTFGLAGHPGVGRLPALGLLLDGVHLVVVSVWIGGVGCIVAGRRIWLGADAGSESLVASRFLRHVPAAIVVIVATGVFQTWRVVRHMSALGDSAYGRLFIGKVVIVVIVVIVGLAGWSALRRFGPSSTVRLLVAQSALGLMVLGASAGLVGLSPGATIRLQPATVSVSRGSLTAVVTVTPARVGSDDVHVIVSQSDALEPSAAVRLSISQPDRGIPATDIPLTPDGPDHYSAFGVGIPYAGVWQVSIEVDTAAGATTSLTTSVTIAS